jgi:hypothetical protein
MTGDPTAQAVPETSMLDEWRIQAILDSGQYEPFEEHLIRMLQPERQADLHEFSKILVTCPKFERELEVRIRKLLDCNFDGHVDGYLACMGALSLKLGFVPDDGSKSDSIIRRGAIAVAKLRASPGPSHGQLEQWITFGLVIVTFAMTALGTAATTVRRHILKHVAAQEHLPIDFQYCDPLIPMVVFETWECLMKRSVPVINVEIGDNPPPVDRLFGLATSLLPHLFELCKISHDMTLGDEDNRSKLQAARKVLRRNLEDWQPCPPPNFLSDYSTIEVVHLLCQAEVHRKGALLFLHGIEHPFGEEDDAAELQAREILNEIKRAQLITGTRVQSIALPWFLAGVNARDSDLRAEIMKQAEKHMDPTCPLIGKQCEVFLPALWQIRDVSLGFFWLDLMKHLPDVTMPL